MSLGVHLLQRLRKLVPATTRVHVDIFQSARRAARFGGLPSGIQPLTADAGLVEYLHDVFPAFGASQWQQMISA